MKKILNALCYFIKHLLLVTAIVGSFYVIFYMFERLGKNLTESVEFFAPFGLLLLLFVINMSLNQKKVIRNAFYNATCCVVLGFITFACYRAVFDVNMLAAYKMGYNINFNYFADLIRPIEVMLYGLIIANIFLMFGKDIKESKPSVITPTVLFNEDAEPDIKVRFKSNRNNQYRGLSLDEEKEEPKEKVVKKKSTTTKNKPKTPKAKKITKV
ncbi:MAG: hypothetical protein RSE91_00190 [Bacilli bacterium]